jgi:hypothetical protein
MLVLLIEGIYELRHLDGLSCVDKHTKFHKDLFSHSKVNRGGYTYKYEYTGAHTRTARLSQNKEDRLKI